MELVGKLKDQVENSSNKEEAKKLIEKAGMRLSDEELSQVSGGGLFGTGYTYEEERDMAKNKINILLYQFKDSNNDSEKTRIWVDIRKYCQAYDFPLPIVN